MFLNTVVPVICHSVTKFMYWSYNLQKALTNAMFQQVNAKSVILTKISKN